MCDRLWRPLYVNQWASVLCGAQYLLMNIWHCIDVLWSRDSATIIVTGYGLDGRRV